MTSSMLRKKQSKNKSGARTLENSIGWLLIILGIIGFIASSTLAIEKVALLKDPNYVPSCNISPLLSCGSVMNTPQAEAFGFPNPFIGVAGFAVVVTIGAAILAGAKFKRWFWLGLQAGTLFGIIFIHWLFYQSVYSIGALCPYCMVVWSVTIPLFWYTLLYNISSGHINLSDKWNNLFKVARRNHGNILVVWFMAIVGAILVHFWYYWETLI